MVGIKNKYCLFCANLKLCNSCNLCPKLAAIALEVQTFKIVLKKSKNCIDTKTLHNKTYQTSITSRKLSKFFYGNASLLKNMF